MTQIRSVRMVKMSVLQANGANAKNFQILNPSQCKSIPPILTCLAIGTAATAARNSDYKQYQCSQKMSGASTYDHAARTANSNSETTSADSKRSTRCALESTLDSARAAFSTCSSAASTASIRLRFLCTRFSSTAASLGHRAGQYDILHRLCSLLTATRRQFLNFLLRFRQLLLTIASVVNELITTVAWTSTAFLLIVHADSITSIAGVTAIADGPASTTRSQSGTNCVFNELREKWSRVNEHRV